jgi:hypothetical protein
MVDGLHRQQYAVSVLVCMRDWHAMTQSQIRAGEVRRPGQALENIRFAYRDIFAACAELPYVCASYSALIAHPVQYAGHVCQVLGLPAPERLPLVRDENAKYYGDG